MLNNRSQRSFVLSAFYLRLNSRRSALMMVVGIWLLMSVVLANAYASTLLSFLSVTKLGPIINSLEELADSKNVNVIVQAGTDITNRFLVSENIKPARAINI